MASVGSESGDVISLNIMPMLDIFSILILFLLMNFSTDPISHDLNEGIELPESATIRSLDELPTVIVSKGEVFVNDKQISTIINGDIKEQDRSQGAIFPLFSELEKLAEANKRIAEAKGRKNELGTITLEMDKTHNFALLKRVMISAEQADFVKFKLMVAKELN